MATNQAAANKAVFRHFYDVINTHDREAISVMIKEVVRPDAVLHVPLPVDAAGAAGVEYVMTTFLRAYPDLNLAVQDMVAEDDKVVSRTVVTGTHEGDFQGHPATGRAVRYEEIFIGRFVGGRIAELWGVADVYSHLKQLGVIAA
jgi:steroid delta-isomerase-like uncharacterized protein